MGASLHILQLLQCQDPTSVVLRDAVGSEEANELAANDAQHEPHPTETVLEADALLGLKRAGNLRLTQGKNHQV